MPFPEQQDIGVPAQEPEPAPLCPMKLAELNHRFGDVLWHINQAHTFSTDYGSLIDETEMDRAKNWVRRIYDIVQDFGMDTQDKQNWLFGKKCLSFNATYVAIVLIQKMVTERHPLERAALPGADVDQSKYGAFRIVQFFQGAKDSEPKYYRFRSDRENGIRHTPIVSKCQFASNKSEWKDRAVTMDFLLDMIGAGRLPTEVHLAEPPPPPRTDGFHLSNREITRRMVIQMFDTRKEQRANLKRKAEVDRAAFIDALPDEDIRKRVAHRLAARMEVDKKARVGDVNDMMQHNDNLARVLNVNFNKPDMSGLKEGTSGSGVLQAQLVRAQQEEADFDAEYHAEYHAMDLGSGRDTDADAY
jgi:hypothetical protein